MDNPKTLAEYLLNRGLTLNPIELDKGDDPILENDELLREVAGIANSNGGAILLVLQARINALGKELLNKATPYEVPELRRSIVELSAIVDDFKGYEEEFKRREKARGGEQSASESVESTPTEPPKEGEEGTL